MIHLIFRFILGTRLTMHILKVEKNNNFFSRTNENFTLTTENLPFHVQTNANCLVRFNLTI